MKLTFTESKIIEELIYTGSVELVIEKLHKHRKTVEHHLYWARKNNQMQSSIHLCIAYLLHNPSVAMPDNLKPAPELPQLAEIIKTDYSNAIVTVNDDVSDIDDIIQFKDLRAIYDVPKA